MARAEAGVRVRRVVAGALVGAVALASAAVAPARADSTNFNPTVNASLGNDAARQPSAFSLKITQKDGEEQIGPLSLSVPRTPDGYTLNTNVSGNGTQIGTIHVVLYTDPRPSTLTIDGTLNDDNAASDCKDTAGSTKQCITAHLTVAPGVVVDAPLYIYETADSYSIGGDLTDTWKDPQVQGLNARLAELSTTIYAKVGNQVVFQNPDVGGSYPLSYDMTSAAVPGYSVGGRTPVCAPSCAAALNPKEYAPSAPGLQAPANGAAYLSTSAIAFKWGASSDKNGDSVTYEVRIDGGPVAYAGPSPWSTMLTPGHHTWTVSADDEHSAPTTSATWSVDVIDPSSALQFASVTSGEVLYVQPALKAFVYALPGGAQYGGTAPGATGQSGYIAYNGAFQLIAAYDAGTTKSAAGTLLAGGGLRPFVGSLR